MDTDILLTPPPDTVYGVFVDRYFIQHLRSKIEGINPSNRKELPKEQRYKRTPFDTLFEKGVMTNAGVIGEYIRVKQKTSKLPAGCRNAILYMVTDCTQSMYNTYRKINCMT
jgi:hypothetical protein